MTNLTGEYAYKLLVVAVRCNLACARRRLADRESLDRQELVGVLGPSTVAQWCGSTTAAVLSFYRELFPVVQEDAAANTQQAASADRRQQASCRQLNKRAQEEEPVCSATDSITVQVLCGPSVSNVADARRHREI